MHFGAACSFCFCSSLSSSSFRTYEAAADEDMKVVGGTCPRTSDRECLESWARHRDAESLQTLVERYLVFVYSSALRRTGDAAQAAEVTRAVFLVLARRARRLRKNTVLAGWLFHVTGIACWKRSEEHTSELQSRFGIS